ncbi:IclR family transcriptional regulator [Aureimonas fodinaquatilis]|uniref:IclR family transcriptional regulator n=1 Tax=Aureimonas fodinaquatilis TaxID=2565783 RepID=A0A5B0DSW1_9HYPH|nr:IclR family transcriptional regulator [Aureimonas fodinaquatilis]KAA0969075.1 IclR family transcriptional regulator [Aureimonas fodinaquatilis]
MKDPYLISSLGKALSVIDLFTEQPTWSLAELAAKLDTSKPTIFRILHTFEDSGYLSKDVDTGRYHLGMRFYALGNSAIRNEQLSWQAYAPLQELATQTGETVYVGILFGGEAVCVQLVDGSATVRMHSFIGKRSPAHASTLGKVILAHLPSADVDDFLQQYGMKAYTPNTITEPESFKQELRRIFEDGFAIDNEELELGLSCVGAPVSDNTGRVFATIAVSAPVSRMGAQQIVKLVPMVQQTARQISRLLGSPVLHENT